jgi:exosortase D (VPLPA-CTERM-specific)
MMAALRDHPPYRGVVAVSLLLVAAAALWLIFGDGLTYMVLDWGLEEYSYAYLVPPIAAWLIWQRRGRLVEAGAGPSWWGAPVVAAAVGLGAFGELATLYVVIQYAFVLAVIGVALTLLGWRGLRVIWAPLFYLFFIIPLPGFLYQGLSAQLQLISSALGVAFIRLFGLSVFLEGNIIDLGTYQLQVAEACSGLRYLFPLLSFGYLCAMLYNGPWWHKVVLLLSTLPITILVNSLRIGFVGILVHGWGIEQAEGFMHLFEGWIIFLAAVAILFGEMWLLARLSGRRGRLADLLDLDEIWPKAIKAPALGLARPVLLSCFVLLLGAAGALALPARPEIVPSARNLALFSLALDEWHGLPIALERHYIEALRFDDYVLADYSRTNDRAPVNFYLAYYGSQRKGASVHSPRTCIPGGGWEVASLSRIVVDTSPAGISTAAGRRELGVNRVIIARGAEKQLVYYWFDQRGRQMTNEYVVKLMLAWDALTRRRTDGALVRVVTPVRPGEDLAAADERLQDFLRAAYPEVRAFVPA